MSSTFVTVFENKVTGKIIADSFEAAEAFVGEGCVVIETEATGLANEGDNWDGTVFTTPVEEPEVITEPEPEVTE
jgi:hypothetical protein